MNSKEKETFKLSPLVNEFVPKGYYSSNVNEISNSVHNEHPIADEPESDNWVEVRPRSRKDVKVVQAESRTRHLRPENRKDTTYKKKPIARKIPEVNLLQNVVKSGSYEREYDVSVNENGKEKCDIEIAAGCSSKTANEYSLTSETKPLAKKKKKKSNAQQRKDFQKRLDRLPSTQGKVFTVTSEVFQFMNKGEQHPRILNCNSVLEEPNLWSKEFPALGQESTSTAIAEESLWSDVEANESSNRNRVLQKNSKIEEYPELGASTKSKTSFPQKKPNYNELFKKVTMNATIDGDSDQKSSSVVQANSQVVRPGKSKGKDPKAINKPTTLSKPKSNSLIKFDLANMLNKGHDTNKLKLVPEVKEKKMVKMKGVVANILDSSAPTRRRGKERETPRKRKPTTMKKIILKEKEERKQAKLVVSQESETILTSDISGDSRTINEPTLDAVIHPIDNQDVNLTPVIPSQAPAIHSRKFREYCHQMLSSEIDEVATKLIQDLIRFHDKVYQKDPVKAKMRRRMVIGLREIMKHLKLKRIKCLILAPNLERISNQGGLDDAMNNIISLANELDVPLVFALGRRKLGRVCLKKVPVSGVGIFNYDGSEVNFKRLMELTMEGKKSYNGNGNEENVNEVNNDMKLVLTLP